MSRNGDTDRNGDTVYGLPVATATPLTGSRPAFREKLGKSFLYGLPPTAYF
jgi:hypothetical protein